MSVPGRVDAAALLRSLQPPAWHLRHVRAVAEVAAWLAYRAVAAGHPVDRALVEAAALLHDVDKVLSADDPIRSLAHGVGSAAWVTARGHPELAAAITRHPVTRLGDRDADAWLDRASGEELLVAYADKRARQRLVSMAGRFADWTRRYPESADWHGWSGAEAAAVRRRAERLESKACALAGVAPEAVRRLPWTGRALAAARAIGLDPARVPAREPAPEPARTKAGGVDAGGAGAGKAAADHAAEHAESGHTAAGAADRRAG